MLGIFGGTFNPVHYGHLRTAIEIKQHFALDEVRLIPCANPPHRQSPTVAAQMRLEMLQLAVANCPGLVADGCEVARAGPSYTVDTLRELRATLTKQPILLFMGMDAFAGLQHWYEWQCLFEYAHIVVMTRPGFALTALDPVFSNRQFIDGALLRSMPAGGLFFQQVTQLDISATAIRAMIASGKDPHYLLPDSVIDYIQQHNLYR